MEKNRVIDLLRLFENGKYSKPETIAIVSDVTEKTLMWCTFESWNNIDTLILDCKVNGCSVTGSRGEHVLTINVGGIS